MGWVGYGYGHGSFGKAGSSSLWIFMEFFIYIWEVEHILYLILDYILKTFPVEFSLVLYLFPIICNFKSIFNRHRKLAPSRDMNTKQS